MVSHAAIEKNQNGIYNPTSITVIAKRQIGAIAPANWSDGYIKIESTTNNSSWTNVYSGKAATKTQSIPTTSGLVALRCSLYYDSGYSNLLDQQTIPIVSDGTDGAPAYTVVLSNESHTFSAGTSAVTTQQTATCNVIAYKGSSQTTCYVGSSTSATSITTGVSGLTCAISNNNSQNVTLTFTATTALNTKNGTVSIPVVVDGKSFTKIFTFSLALTGTSVTGVSTSKSGDETTITISMSDGTSKEFKVKDGAQGDTGATAQWYYGKDLTHTSGTATLATSKTSGVVVGSMYLNPDTSLCYRCTAVDTANGTATWIYAGDLTTGVINNIEIGGRNLLIANESYSNIINTTKSFTLSGWVRVLWESSWINEHLEVGQQYILSYDATLVEVPSGYTASNETRGCPVMLSLEQGWVKRGSNDDGIKDNRNYTVGETHHYEFQFIFQEVSETQRYYGISFYSVLRRNSSGQQAHDTFRIDNLKLEKGNIPTDWTPAPEDLESSISSVNTTLANYISTNDAALAAVKDQADKSFDTWFYSGQPTANNAPANTWTDNATKKLHVGDMYYDTATGNAYTYNSSYQWVAQSSSNIASTDAITAAETLANSKIKTYAVAAEPTSGMSSGDLWIDTDDNNRMYRYDGTYWIDVQTEVNVGGRNLILKSANTSEWPLYTPNEYTIAKVNLAEDFIRGETYTVTIWGGPITRSDKTSCWYSCYWGGGTFVLGSVTMIKDGVYSKTFTVSETSTAQVASPQIMYIFNTPGVGASGTTYSAPITKIKLEKGNKSTDWTPAPEDGLVEVGGRNLVLNTGYMPVGGTGGFRESGGTVSHIDISTPPVAGITGGIRVTNSESSTAQIGFAQDNRANTFIAGEQYTESCWIRASSSFSTIIRLEPIWRSSTQTTGASAISTTLTTDWQYFKWEGHVLNGTQANSYSCGYAYAKTVPAGGYIEVCGVKVERGNKATDWTPAPEDVDSQIQSLKETLENQIDGKIETWAQSTNPASGWTTVELQSQHDGDLWYYTGESNGTYNNNTTYKYIASSASWSEYSASTDLLDMIDGKSTIFYGTTSGTYSGVQVGDYLIDSTDGSSYKWDGSKWVKVIDSVKVGGRNLLLNSAASADNLPIVGGNGATFETEDGYSCYKATGSSTVGMFYGTPKSNTVSPKLKSNTTYIYSAWIKVTTTASGITYVNHTFTSLGHHQVYNSNSTASDKAHEDIVGERVYKPAIVNIGEWTYITEQFTTNDLDNSIFGKYIKYNLGSDYTVYVRGMKLEKGNIATDWSPAPEDTEAAINDVQTNLDNYIASSEIIVGTQTAKTGTWTGVAGFSELKDGQQIAYWLPYEGSGNATLNLTLSGGGTTGAIPVYYRGTTRVTTHYGIGTVIHLTYRVNANVNGTNYTGWWADASYNSDTFDRIRYSSAVIIKTAFTNDYPLLVSDSSGYFILSHNISFDINKPILYYYSTTDITTNGSTSTNGYLAFSSFTLTNTISGFRSTKGYPVYIVGTLNGSTFTTIDNSTNYIIGGNPTTATDYYYILLGQMTGTTTCSLYPEHPIYKFVNDEFKSLNQVAYEAQVAADEAKQDVVDLDNSFDQAKVFDRLTDGKKNQGLYIENGNVYLNAEMINTGYFTVTDKNTGKELFRAGNGEDGPIVSIKALDDLGAYFNFSDDGLIIGKNNSSFELHITDREMGFYDGANKVAYINDNKLYINSAEVSTKNNGNLMLGDFAFIPQANGNLSFRKVK